jgi:Reverse transcriptase (RNA-dependent DNA polymerase)
MRQRVMGWYPINARMCKLRIKGRFFNYSIINVHCPHEGRPDDEKEAFYEQLEEVYDGCPLRDVKIVIGDLNAQVGREAMYRPVIGPNSLHAVSNNNGQRCVNFAASRGMVIRSTFFPRKDIHKATWRSPDQLTENQIDHVLIDGKFFSDIINVRTYRSANIDSDHYLVAVCMRSKLSTVYNTRRSRTPRPNIEQLRDAGVAQEYAQQLGAALPTEEQLGAATLEDGWRDIRTAIGSTALAALGTSAPNRRNDWFDGECKQLVEEKNAARARMLQHRTRANVERYRQARNRQNSVFRRKKRQQEERDREAMEELYRANDTRKFYEKLNRSRKGYVPQADMCRDLEGNLLTNECEVIERWKQYYDEHLNGDTADSEGGTVTNLGARAEDDRFPAPDLQEVEEEIGRLKNNKSAGVDQLPSELLKYGGEPLGRALHWVITKIWEEEVLPEEWMEGIVCPIYKKGDKLDCCNYRAITLLSAAYKVLSQILCRRLSPIAKEFVGQYQAGFMGARATTDQIFAIRQILQKCREYNVPTHHLFIDFKSAYDTIDRDQLWQIMHEYGFPDKLTRLVKATMDRVMCVVRVSGTLSSPFESRRGLRQGDGLSCLLFNIALEGVIRRARIDTSGTIFRKSVQLLGFADDIDIMARNFETMAATYIRLKAEANRIGLAINASKTKYMRGRGSREVNVSLPPRVLIDGDEIEVVDEFVYLGSLVTADNDTSREIQRRIMAGNRAYFGLRRTLRSNKVRRTTKLTIYKTLIRPVVLYGHETWTMLAEDQRALAVFERKVLRTICGGVQMDDGTWRRRMNHELHQLLGEPPIVHTAKIGRLRWAGHVIRMSDDSPVKMVLDNEPTGIRRRGAQRARWIDHVEGDLRTLRRLRGWRQVATNRVEWRRLLCTARDTQALA